MHELAVTTYLLEAVEAHAQHIGARKVLTIKLIVGEQAGIVDDSLRFCFDLLTPGTSAEGAQLTILRTQMRFHCAACNADYHPAGTDFACSHCGRVGQIVDDGSGLLIESMEVET